MLIMNASTPKGQQQHFHMRLSPKNQNIVMFYTHFVVLLFSFFLSFHFPNFHCIRFLFLKQILKSVSRQSMETNINRFIFIALAFFKKKFKI